MKETKATDFCVMRAVLQAKESSLMASFRMAEIAKFSRFLLLQSRLQSDQAAPSLLLSLWSLALAFAWVLPNHYLPWTAFHSDAWSAVMMGVMFVVLCFIDRERVVWHEMALVSGFLVGIPFLQHAFGMLPFSGQAWVSSTYLLGFLLALLAGARWERSRPGQMADALFLAIGVASILSVGLQLYQWLGLDGLDIWSMGYVIGRPYANLGQPNQLATLLLWGLLAAAWGAFRGKIRAPFAILMACFLSIGIALAASRTAWVGLLLLVCAAWMWKKCWSSIQTPWTVSAIAVFVFLLQFSLKRVDQLLLLFRLDGVGDRLNGSGGRFMAWRMFADAVVQHPWFGYGWSGVGKAQLAVALDHPHIYPAFQDGHNLFLDLLLWCGLPIGLTVSALIIWWLIQRVRHIDDAQSLVLLMSVLVIGNHAMLEFPLQYAYFLLPTGLIIGALDVRCKALPVFTTSRLVFVALCALAALLLAGIVRDYFRVEKNIYALRFEVAHVGSLPPAMPPDVIFLTQWYDLLWFARVDPKTVATRTELAMARDVAEANPGLGQLYKLALSLAYNGMRDEAQTTLAKMCMVVSPSECETAKRSWAEKSLQEPKIAAVPWPKIR